MSNQQQTEVPKDQVLKVQLIVFSTGVLLCDSLCIVNDQLFIRMATTEEIRRAFVAPAPTPSSSPVPTLTASQQDMLTAFSQKSGMNLEWSQKWALFITAALHITWQLNPLIWIVSSLQFRCLQDNAWDFNAAARVFTQLKVKKQKNLFSLLVFFYTNTQLSFQIEGKIPDVAFMKWRPESCLELN